MKIENVSIEIESRRSVALPLGEPYIHAVIPVAIKGVYVLLDSQKPVYVGRSDVCLRNRLDAHARCKFGTHFMWQPVLSTLAGYYLEAYLFHKYSPLYRVRNRIHPDIPSGELATCPFCHSATHLVTK
jgi:hypothetical protein